MESMSVIIPTYHDWQRLSLCLERVRNALPADRFTEVIVVDNAAVHDVPGYVSVFPGLKIIHEPRPGSYAARNRGAEVARGEWLAFTDSDCIPSGSWLTGALQVVAETNCDAIGGKISIFKPSDGHEIAYMYEKKTAFNQEVHVPAGRCVTANFFVKRSVFSKLKGFDASMKSGGDWEFSSRLVKQGCKLVYGENVLVWHPSRSSLKDIFKKQRRLTAGGYSNVRLRHRHSGIRIFLSHAFRQIPATFRRMLKGDSLKEKSVIFGVSVGLYFYRLWLMILLMTGLLNPETVRE
jgi:GT2 family glycosyltransferase